MKTLKKLILLIAAAMMLAAMVSCSHEAGTENGGGTGTGTQTTPEYPIVFDGVSPIEVGGETVTVPVVLRFYGDNTWIMSSVIRDTRTGFTITIETPTYTGTYTGNPESDGELTLTCSHVGDGERTTEQQENLSNQMSQAALAGVDATIVAQVTWNPYTAADKVQTITITDGTSTYMESSLTRRQ